LFNRKNLARGTSYKQQKVSALFCDVSCRASSGGRAIVTGQTGARAERRLNQAQAVQKRNHWDIAETNGDKVTMHVIATKDGL